MTERAKASLIGALVAVIAILLEHLLTHNQRNIESIPYWGGVAIGGALLVIGVSALAKSHRP